MREALLEAGRSVRWYLRQFTGEAKWDEYVAHCRAHGVEPMSRREFERQRADRLEGESGPSRCC